MCIPKKANLLQFNCGENQRAWFSLETNWLFTAAPVMVDETTWKFNIEMTLTTRISSLWHGRSPWLEGEALQDHLQNPPPASEAPFPWAPLHSSAFRSKHYTLTLSRGRFIEPWHLSIKAPYPIFKPVPQRFAPYRYKYQLAFDVSPYPPREEFNERGDNSIPELALDFHLFWEKKEFVKEGIARKDETWAEWLGLGWWLSPTAGDLHKRKMLGR
jgi:hypothetical protein